MPVLDQVTIEHEAPDRQRTIFAPIPPRQDETILGPLFRREDQTVIAPLGPIALAPALPLPSRLTPAPPSRLTVRAPRAQAIAIAVAHPARRVGSLSAAWAHARELLQVGLILAGIFLGLRMLLQTFQVDGSSMNPTFESGQRLIVNKLAYWHIEGTPFEGLLPGHAQGSISFLFSGPRRGDVVVFRPPTASNFESDLIKRIIGLPGDVVSIQAGRVFVNGELLDEPYVQVPADYTYPGEGLGVLVPDDGYFVLGDNRPVSADSHLGWVVSVQKLVGQASVTYWPPSRVGLFSL